MDDAPMVVTAAWVAAQLGRSESWFAKKRPSLEGQGFPRRDAILGGYIRADVEAWIARRRQVADVTIVQKSDDSGIKFDML